MRVNFLYSHLRLFILMACFLLLFVSQQSFTSVVVPIDGKVESFKKGVYTIRTSTGLIHIKKSKIGYNLDQKLNKSIGNKVQVDVPPEVIASFQQFRTSRRPSSDEDNK